MKIALIVPGDLELQPYLFNYTDVFDSNNISYDYISWNRDMESPNIYNDHKVVSFGTKSSVSKKNIFKLLDYLIFSRNVIRYLKNNHYDYVIIFTIPNAIFLKGFLFRFFKNKYLLDIRDYSVLYPYFKKSINKLVSFSLFTSISSHGFLSWLPINSNYIISHNILKSSLVKSFQYKVALDLNDLTVLTIGRIRDYSINKKFIEALGNKENIKILIAGTGTIKDRLEIFFKSRYNNIFFTGKYKKEDESSIVNSSSILNIILPKDTLSTSLMSNRFYLGIANRKPLIVNQESHQAHFVRKYNLGIVIKSEDNLYENIVKYVSKFNSDLFTQGCDHLNEIIYADICKFESKLISSFKIIREDEN